jgi:hypothetical protein
MVTNAQAIAEPATTSTDARLAPRDDFHAELERALIVTYLRARGYTLRSVREMPAAEGQELLKAANGYAALRLTEIEARMHYLDAIHGRS